jgi:hypothetical protein
MMFEQKHVSSRCLFLLIFLFLTSYARNLPDATSKVLVFSDQINDNPGSPNFIFAANHYIGMQKIDKGKIDAYKLINPDFIAVQYHKAYGVDLGDNITNAYSPYWNRDCDSLYAWQKRNPQYGPLENYYLHTGNQIDSAHRIEHIWDNVNEYWLADIRQEGYKKYIAEETARRCKDIGFDGTFYDCAYFPSYGYIPENWCTTAPWNVQSITQFNTQWNDTFAIPFWKYISNYYHSEGRDLLCLPNCDQMVTGWYDDKYLDNVDGAMVEGFFTYGGLLTGGDWLLSAGRILKYLTGNGKNKVMIAQPGVTADNIKQRRWCIANYFLLKNRFSYYNIPFSSTANWWPEYDINLGAFVSTPTVLNDLLVTGKTSLYKRDYQNGMVLVNPGTVSENYTLTAQYKPISFSGGGNCNNGNLPALNLTIGSPVTGVVTIASGEALILQNATDILIKIGLKKLPLEGINQNYLPNKTLNGRMIINCNRSASQLLVNNSLRDNKKQIVLKVK